MSATVTHKSRCDLESCVNYNIDFDVKTMDGTVRVVWCAPCDRDITHTVRPL